MICCLSEERIQGAFSIQKTSKVGTGATAKKTTATIYVYVCENPEGKIEVQAVNENHVPFGPLQTISREELLADYLPEPEYYHKELYPRLVELNKHLASGERHLKLGQPFTAELNFQSALKLDEQNIRANFGIGLVYLQQGDKDKADLVLRRLVDLEAAFEARHKHLFNEFGMQLRKAGMCGQALEYYTRALDFAQDDENLYFNIARAHLENNDLAGAKKALQRALALNPGFSEARDWLARLDKPGLTLKAAPPAPVPA